MEPEFSPGDRIKVVVCPRPAGATGTVTRWDPHPLIRQLSIDWDAPHAHRRLVLTLVAGGDRVTRI